MISSPSILLDGTPQPRPTSAFASMGSCEGPLQRYLGRLLRGGFDLGTRDDCLALALESFDLGAVAWTGKVADLGRLLAEGEVERAGSLLDRLTADHFEREDFLVWWRAWLAFQSGDTRKARECALEAMANFPDSDLFLFARTPERISQAESSPFHASNYATFWSLSDALSINDRGFAEFVQNLSPEPIPA